MSEKKLDLTVDPFLDDKEKKKEWEKKHKELERSFMAIIKGRETQECEFLYKLASEIKGVQGKVIPVAYANIIFHMIQEAAYLRKLVTACDEAVKKLRHYERSDDVVDDMDEEQPSKLSKDERDIQMEKLDREIQVQKEKDFQERFNVKL